MKILVAKMALAASVAFATLIAAEAASAQPQRQLAASEAYGFDPTLPGMIGPAPSPDSATCIQVGRKLPPHASGVMHSTAH